jgi:hypothetical protein
MKKENIAILIVFTLFLYCYDLVFIMTSPDFASLFIGWLGYFAEENFNLVFLFENIFREIFEYFFKPRSFSAFPPGLPLFIWLILFMIIVMFYIYIIIKCLVNDKIKIFIGMKIINLVLIPFWTINYYFIIYHIFNSLLWFVLGGFVALIFFIGINYIIQILVSLPSILYINFLYKNHSIKIIERVLHTVLQFILVLGLFDSIYLIIKYKKHNGKANVA